MFFRVAAFECSIVIRKLLDDAQKCSRSSSGLSKIAFTMLTKAYPALPYDCETAQDDELPDLHRIRSAIRAAEVGDEKRAALAEIFQYVYREKFGVKY